MAQRNRKQNLLERLEQESWQLELLISGFSIFLLIAAKEPLEVWTMSVGQMIQLSYPNSPLNLLPVVVYGSWFFMTINLLLHVLLRGMWISAIGLRSVSGGVDVPSLRLRGKFQRFLRPRLQDYDAFIERLERLSSVMFAYTFLVIFALISMVMTVLTFYLVSRLSSWLENWQLLDEEGTRYVNLSCFIILGISLFVYFLDFVTLGWLKRFRRFAVGYYPFYRFWGWITLAALYRPLYYNLIDHTGGRRLARLIVPYIFLLSVGSAIYLPGNTYLPSEAYNGLVRAEVYADQRPPGGWPSKLSLPSMIVRDGWLPITLMLSEDELEALPLLCPSLPVYRKSLVRTEAFQPINDTLVYEPARIDTLQDCLQALYQWHLDDSLYRPAYAELIQHARYEIPALLFMLDVADLPRGRHVLRLATAEERRDTVRFEPTTRVPFFVE